MPVALHPLAVNTILGANVGVGGLLNGKANVALAAHFEGQVNPLWGVESADLTLMDILGWMAMAAARTSVAVTPTMSVSGLHPFGGDSLRLEMPFAELGLARVSDSAPYLVNWPTPTAWFCAVPEIGDWALTRFDAQGAMEWAPRAWGRFGPAVPVGGRPDFPNSSAALAVPPLLYTMVDRVVSEEKLAARIGVDWQPAAFVAAPGVGLPPVRAQLSVVLSTVVRHVPDLQTEWTLGVAHQRGIARIGEPTQMGTLATWADVWRGARGLPALLALGWLKRGSAAKRSTATGTNAGKTTA